MHSQPDSARHAQRGAATLTLVLTLLGALLLATVFANRGLLLEARMAANQARSTVAFEAAEAGLEWTLAQLNSPARIGDDCRPDAASATSFRERYLTIDLTPSVAPRPACVRSDAGWSCTCRTDSAVTAGEAADAAFTVELLPGSRAGVVRVAVTGSAGNGVLSRIETPVALLPAIAAAPAAPLTARGRIAVGAAALGLHNVDPAAGGIALHAGGTVDAGATRLTLPSGASTAGTFAGLDAGLAGLDAERLFTIHFGLSRRAWRDQPTVQRLECSGDCTSALAAAIGPDVANPLVWIRGDIVVNAPISFGRPDRPVVLVVDGHLELRGTVELHGLVYANGVAWTGAGGGAIHGALVSAGDFIGDAAADVHRDRDVLTILQRRIGTFVRIAGGWRDF